MTESNGLRQAVRRACKGGTLVSCESCGRVESSPLAPSKAVGRLGWWRVDHDMIICDGCYRPPTEHVFVEQVFDGSDGLPPASAV